MDWVFDNDLGNDSMKKHFLLQCCTGTGRTGALEFPWETAAARTESLLWCGLRAGRRHWFGGDFALWAQNSWLCSVCGPEAPEPSDAARAAAVTSVFADPSGTASGRELLLHCVCQTDSTRAAVRWSVCHLLNLQRKRCCFELTGRGGLHPCIARFLPVIWFARMGWGC